jgi:glycolate oxidase FAD binding subunit
MVGMPAHRLEPASSEDLAALLAGACGDGKVVEIRGSGSKRALGGPPTTPDVQLTTRRLAKVLAYEPADLTISVQAGLPWAELTRELAANNQMVPLDPPFFETATVGGALASDSSGPRRRRYGTARDMVIGMQFATAQGKLVSSGGMVVKNVTGLDMAKLMLGSFGTLACITTVNFKLFPRPEREATFVFRHASAEKLLDARRTVLEGVAQPFALDLVNAAAAQGLGLELETPYALLAKAEGSAAVVERYRREYLAIAGRAGIDLVEPAEAGAEALWAAVREFHATALAAHTAGAMLRVSTTATRLAEAVRLAGGECWLLARAANAVLYLGCPTVTEAIRVTEALRRANFATLVESLSRGATLEQWSDPGSALAAMRRLKATFDPRNRLNPGRLWGRL